MFLDELNIKPSLPIHCYNNSAIQTIANHVFHERTKHFEIELFFLREKVSIRIVKTIKIKSADDIADIFTKVLRDRITKGFVICWGYLICIEVSLRGNIKRNKLNSVLWMVSGIWF